MDLGPAYFKSVSAEGHATQSIICADPFHLVKLVGDALDVVARAVAGVAPSARRPLRSRLQGLALLKEPREPERAPEHATRGSQAQPRRHLARLRDERAVLGDLSWRPCGQVDAIVLLDRWIDGALRCRLASFVKVTRTMRQRQRGIIVNALEQGISNGRVEGMNTKVRLRIRRAYGFHSAEAALALVMLACGPINLKLPHERLVNLVTK